MVKLYRDEETGEVKGDASICFVQEASVEIALSVYNQAPLRDEDAKGTLLTVAKADFSKSNHGKKETEEANDAGKEQKGKKDRTWDRRVKMRKLKQQQGGFHDDWSVVYAGYNALRLCYCNRKRVHWDVLFGV